MGLPEERPPGLDSPWTARLIKYGAKAQVRAFKLTNGRIGCNWRIGAGFRKPVPTLLLEHVGRKSGRTFTTPVLYLERGGKSALAFTGDDGAIAAATRDLAATARARRLDTLTVEQVNGSFIHGTGWGRALREAGFVESPRGLTLRRLTAGDAERAARQSAGTPNA